MTHISPICAWYTHTTITYSSEHHPCTHIVLGAAQQQRHGEAAATEHLFGLLAGPQLHAVHLRGKGLMFEYYSCVLNLIIKLLKVDTSQ